MKPLQRVLRVAARVVFDRNPRDHITCALRELHWLPISERVVYKLCFLVHKASLGQSPDYITCSSQALPLHPGPHCGTRRLRRPTDKSENGKSNIFRRRTESVEP